MRKTYKKDNDGNKIYNKPREYILSSLDCDPFDCEEIKLNSNSLNFHDKKQKYLPFKDIKFNIKSSTAGSYKLRSASYKVNLTKMNCTCPNFKYNKTKNYKCKHILESFNKWKNDESTKFFVKSKDNIYLVDTEENSCSCPHSKFRKATCKHLNHCRGTKVDDNLEIIKNLRIFKKITNK